MVFTFFVRNLGHSIDLLATVLTCIADRYYVAKVSGVAFPVVDDCMTDSNVLLLLSMFVTCSHVYLPIRWLVLLPHDMCVLFFYAVLEYGIGGPERAFAHFYLLLLAILVFTSLLTSLLVILRQKCNGAKLYTEDINIYIL